MTALKACPNPACGGGGAQMTEQGRAACTAWGCFLFGPDGDQDGAKWNAMLRPADIVAARIEGLREGFALAYDKFEMKGASRGYDAWQEPEATPTVEPVIDLMAALKDALEKRKGAGR